MLPLSIALQRMKSIATRHFQVLEPCGQIQVFKLTSGAPSHISGKSSSFAGCIQLFGAPIGETLDRITKCNSSRDECQ